MWLIASMCFALDLDHDQRRMPSIFCIYRKWQKTDVELNHISETGIEAFCQWHSFKAQKSGFSMHHHIWCRMKFSPQSIHSAHILHILGMEFAVVMGAESKNPQITH